MAVRPAPLAIGALLAAGGVALALLAPSTPGKPLMDAQALARDFDALVREKAAGVRSRATTLGDLPRLAAAVSTDSRTVRDLTREELAFRTQPGEIITIGQVPKDKANKPVVLIMLPEGESAAPALEQVGVRLALAGGKLSVVDVVAVTPQDRADELTGALAVSASVDVTALGARLDAVGAAARLDLPGGVGVELGKRALGGDAAATALPLEGEAARGCKLLVTVPLAPGSMSLLTPVGGVVALLALVIGFVLARRPQLPEVAQLTPQKAPVTSSGVLAAGETVGRYSILRHLGSGGMAEVFLARAMGEAGFEKLVALKVLHKAVASDTMVVEHFLDEARLASRLTHPNIVQIADLGKAGDEYFIAMEYVDGADLERLRERCERDGVPVPLGVALTVVRKICDGLHAAHIAVAADGKPLELVHRDVKAANVFVDKNGVVKVGDFGIAKARSERKQTEVGIVKGTAAYMAPEHRIGQVIDRRADEFAVGAIAYELVTGVPINMDLAVLAAKGRDGWPHVPPPSQLRPEVPAELDAIIFRALAYERDDRYPDCAALEEALGAVQAKLTTTSGSKAVAQWVEQVLARGTDVAVAGTDPTVAKSV